VEPSREQLVELAGLVDSGELGVAIDSTFALSEATAAFERSLASNKHGKVVSELPATARPVRQEAADDAPRAVGGSRPRAACGGAVRDSAAMILVVVAVRV
jgi:hypothetical protein